MADNNELVFQFNSQDGRKYTVKPFIGIYANNKNLCVRLYCLNEDNGRWNPFCQVTVNTRPLAYLEGTIDANVGGMKMLDFLEKNGFGECTPYGVQSCLCTYPIFKFNEDMIRRINPKVFADYAKFFGYEVSSLDEKISSAESKIKPHKQNNNKEQER